MTEREFKRIQDMHSDIIELEACAKELDQIAVYDVHVEDRSRFDWILKHVHDNSLRQDIVLAFKNAILQKLNELEFEFSNL